MDVEARDALLTLHAASLLLPGGGEPALPEGAVLVEGDRIAGVGTFAELAAAHPAARVRNWPGTLGGGLVHEGPLPAAATPRERVHAVLRRGVCAVRSAEVMDPADRAAATRVGLRLLPPTPVGAPGGASDGTGSPGGDLGGTGVGAALAGGGALALVVGERADLAGFLPDGTCVLTVLAGRLLHRRT